MKHPDPRLTTPIYVKTDADLDWPEDESVFYTLSKDGLFVCRNHPFFRSCVPARVWPSELAPQARSLHVRYPLIPREDMERIIGFFSRIADLHGSEAAVLLTWNREEERMGIHVPPQSASVSEGSTGRRYPLEVEYDLPLDLPPEILIIGDVHSHVDEAAYASATDKRDETHRPGVHLVVGRIHDEPPQFHCEVVVDGARFEVEPPEMMEGYGSRSTDFPQEWVARVKVETYRSYSRYGDSRPGNGAYGTKPGRRWS